MTLSDIEYVHFRVGKCAQRRCRRAASTYPPNTDAMKRDTSTCPKSDEGVRSAVKQGALVISLGGGAKTVADELRKRHARAHKSTEWEESR